MNRSVFAFMAGEQKQNCNVYVTTPYREDKALIVEAIKKMKENGLYPEDLWEEG